MALSSRAKNSAASRSSVPGQEPPPSHALTCSWGSEPSGKRSMSPIARGSSIRDIDEQKAAYAQSTHATTLAEIMRGADLFLGLSAKGDMERRGKPRILRRLHGHGRALAEVAVERETVASRAGDFHEACPQQYFLARQYRVYLRSRIKRGAPALSSREDRSLRHQAFISEQAIEDCDGPYRVPGFPLDPAQPSYWRVRP